MRYKIGDEIIITLEFGGETLPNSNKHVNYLKKGIIVSYGNSIKIDGDDDEWFYENSSIMLLSEFRESKIKELLN